MNKKLILISLLTIVMMLFMAGSVCAQDQAVEANKTANVTGVDTATVYIEVNGSSNSTRLPADVVFAIDASGSMSTSDPTGLRKTGAISFINKMNNTTDQVGVVNWANVIKQQQGLTSNFNQAINVVNQNTPGGTTNGALAMQTSINILSLSSLPANQRNIILLTDGLFNEGGNATQTPDQRAIYFATLAKSLGYNVYTIGLGPDVDPVVLTQMASVINGVPQYYFANNASVIDSIYNQIFQIITTKAKNITITDVVPNYMTYVGATIAPTTNNLNPDGTRTLTWNIPSLGQGQSWNVSYNLISMKNGFNIPTNVVANITYTDPENNTGNLTLPIPLVDFPACLNVTKEGNPEPVWPGSLLTYEMSIRNNGPHTAWIVSFSDVLPIQIHTNVQYSLDNVNWSPYTSEQNVVLGSLSVGQIFNFWVRGIVDIDTVYPATLTNTVNAYVNGTLCKNATFISNLIPAADLAIIKTANQTQDLTSGQNVTFTLQVTNLGPNTATNVIAYDPIPTGIASFGAATLSQGTWDPLTGIWNIGILPVGSPATLIFNATITNTFIGNITNIATVNGTEFDPNPLNNHDLIEIFVQKPYVPTADLSICKKVDISTPDFGDIIHFTIGVCNAGPDSAENVVVTDVWPTGLIFVSSTPPPFSIVGNIYTWHLGTIGHNQNATINITAIVNATGLITNFVNVTSTTFDPHPDNNATVNVTVDPAAHVELIKTVDNPAPNYWSLVTFTINAFNTGPNDAEGLQVTDILPDGLSYVSSVLTPGTTYNPITGIWNIGTLLNGTSAFMNITANVTGVGTITNWAFVTNQTTFDPFPWSKDNETINVPLASIFTLNKEWRGTPDGPPITTAQYQDNVWIVFSATNLGPSNATITLSDTLPPGFTADSYWQYKYDAGSWINVLGSWPGSVLFPTVNVGSTLSVAIPGQITVANTTLNNIVFQTSQDTYNPEYPQGPPFGNASAQLDIPPHSHIVITKTVNNPTPNYGSTILFTVTVHNNGPSDAPDVQVVDNLPVGLVFVSYQSSQGIYDSTTGIWNVGALLKNTNATLNITALVNATGEMINWANEANVTINVPPAADLTIDKTVDNPTPNYGDTIHFTVTVFNAGPDSAENVVVTDVWPTGLIFVSSSPSPFSIVGNIYTWHLGTIGHNQNATINITAIVNATGLITNFVNVTSTTFDPHPDNNATVNVTVDPAAHVELIKTVDNSTPNYWSLVTFTINAFNTGPNDAEGVEVTDILPPGLTYVSSIFTPGTTYNPITGIWTIGTLLNGTSAFLNITANVTGIGSITNWASVTNQTTFDPFPPSEDNETINVPPASIFNLHKEWRATQDGTPINTAQYEDSVWVVFSATNIGPSNATITLTDILPTGFTPGSYYQWKIDSGSWNNEPITWPGSDFGFLPVGSTVYIAIPGQISVANTTLNNTVNQTAQDTYNPEYPQGPPYGNASAQLDIPPHADIVITKTVNNPTPNYGSTIIFTVTAHNNGPSDASGVQVVDNLPVGLVFVSYQSSQGIYDSVTGIWDVGALLKNTNATLNITALVNATGEMVNWANEANATINVPAAANVTMTKTSNTPVNVGGTGIFVVSVTNNGPDDAVGVTLIDILLAGFTPGTPSQGTYDPLTGLWDIGVLVNGTTATLNFTKVMTPEDAGKDYCNNATDFSSYTYLLEPVADQQACLHVKKCILVVNVNPTLINTTVGSTVTITYKVGNNGPDTANGVIMTYVIPDGLEFVSAYSPDWGQPTYDPATRTLTWVLGDVPVGDPLLYLNVRVLRAGTFNIAPTIISTTCTGQPVIVAATTINAQEQAEAQAATIGMQTTGVPIVVLVLAVLMVLAGFVIEKRK